MATKNETKTMKFIATVGIVHALSTKAYKSVFHALAELVINALDAARRRGVEPDVSIDFWEKGQHRFAVNSPGISITDNGTGFTDEVIAAYCRVGESARVGHGRHGLGKLAALALTRGSQYMIVSATKDGAPDLYTINTADIFSGQGFAAEGTRRNKDYGMPADGPFTQIFIPDMVKLDPDMVREELKFLLPMTKWKVRVNGKRVEPLQFEGQLKHTTDILRDLGGSVHFRVARFDGDISKKPHGVLLTDKDTGRIVTDLDQQPKAVLRQIERVLFHPALMATIAVPNLESYSAMNRSGLTADFWDSDAGSVLIALMNAFGASMARELVEDDKPKAKDPILNYIDQMQSAFDKAFGHPQVQKEDLEQSTNGNTGPGNIAGPGGTNGSGGSGAGGGGGGGGGGGTTHRRKRVFVKIEDETYQVMTMPATGLRVPAEARSGGIMVVNTAHPAIKYAAEKLSERHLVIVRAIVDAHVDHTREADAPNKVSDQWSLLCKFLTSTT